MSITKLFHHLLNGQVWTRCSVGSFSKRRPGDRRHRTSPELDCIEVFECRTLLTETMISSIGIPDDELVTDIDSADAVERRVSKFILFNRWTRTATDGTGLRIGDPTTLTWSLPADGVTTDNDDNPDAPNNLRAFMDNTFGGGTGNDLTQRPWFRFFNDSLHRLEELAGLTYIYTTADDGVPMRPGNRGILNVRADIRIMGKNIDNPRNTLAYNAFPNDGDMTIDTSERVFLSNSANDFRAIRNVLMHEFMHGLGVEHVDSSDADILLEPTAEDTSDGPQLDDILALQRNYGDALEKLGGDTVLTAIDLGIIPSADSVSRGTLGDSTIVSRSETDFVSIDDESDQDFYQFTVESAGAVTITLTPRGATYMVGPENGTQASFNSRNQGDLTVKLLGKDGVTVLETRNAGGLGDSEVIQDFSLSSPGTYFIQVTSSTTDKIQLYGLDAFYSAIPGGQILGTVFNDLNADGVLDSGESGIPDIRVFVDSNSNSEFDEGLEDFAFTDSDGNYALTGLFEVGNYKLRAVLPSNLQGTTPELGFHEIDLSFEEIVTDVNFGSRMLPVGTSENDSFVLNYTTDNVTITMTTNGGPVQLIGTFPLTSSLIIDGGQGSDSVRVVGTSAGDNFNVGSSTGIQVNGHALTLTSIEQRALAGEAGDDQYVFDTDLPLGLFTLDESGGGADLLDFSPSALAVNVDLGLSTSQIVNTNLTLILGAANVFENASGGTGNDKLIGNSLNNVLLGNRGRDELTGLAGNDILQGGVHTDVYFFDADTPLGEDTIVELTGQGFDFLDFAATSLSIIIDLGITTKQTVNANLKLTLSAGNVIDDVEGGSGNDRITGNSLANFLYGGAGNDVLTGLGGNDELDGMTGNDTYIFDVNSQLGADKVIERPGEGRDNLDFRDSATPLSINLGVSAEQTVSSNLKLTLSEAEVLEEVWGGSGDDILIGNSLGNTLKGGNGNDRLIGNAGSDSLIGGIGDDTYVFENATSPEADFVLEGPSEGVDLLDFTSVTADITLNIGEFGLQSVHANRTLRLEGNPSIENVSTGPGNDRVTGNTASNILNTGGGNDRLSGGAGSDVLIGGTGNDTYHFVKALSPEADSITENPSEGRDLLEFASVTTGITLNLGSTAIQNVHANRTLRLAGTPAIEDVTTGPGNDIITGNSLANVLNTGGGNDRLIGKGGSDSLIGAAGNDTYVFTTAATAEADTVTEATVGGIDLLDFTAVAANITLNAGSGQIQNVHTNRTLRLLGSVGIENISTGSGNDTITGNSFANVLRTGSGNDRLIGKGGSDNLIGGAGNDTYVFSTAATAEADVVTEAKGAGTDTLDFSAISTDLMLSLENSASQLVHTKRTLRLTNAAYFENVIGGVANDVLIGNSGANELDGRNGRDILVGGRGQDSLLGGRGDDILVSGIVNIQLASTVPITSAQFYTKLRQIWSSTAGYVQRVAEIQRPQAAGTGKVVYLRASTTVIRSNRVLKNVFAVPQVDTLQGQTGIDLFFSGVLDLTPDRVSNETLELIT